MKQQNSLWQFFASVKLALFTLFCIAVTSIIGTIIPQKESLEWYASKYGPKTAQLFAVLDIPDMYKSWWFLALLFLLCFNLIICSIDRFPGVWKQVKADGLIFSAERLQKMSNQTSFDLGMSSSEARSHIIGQLKKKGWNFADSPTEGGTLLFAQKGAWTRTGVYIVHTSILVIFLGAIIGSLGGFKGSVVVPETTKKNRIFLYGSGKPIDLGFDVRCNSFAIEFYQNGMPKEYTSSLTILENDREILTKEIEVNDPLSYKGITFYQSSYEAYQDFIITITSQPSGREKSFIVPFQKQSTWPEEGLKFGVINAKALGQSIVSSKIWFTDGDGSPTVEWADDGLPITITRGDLKYQVTAKQMYATGLQVAKDPGVWWVYLGCGLMLFGLYVAFFMSHRRIWFLLRNNDQGCHILFSGTANKNRPGFEKTFEELAELTVADTQNKKR